MFDTKYVEKFVACPNCGHGEFLQTVNWNSPEHHDREDEYITDYVCECGLEGQLVINKKTGKERVEGCLVHVNDPVLYL